MKYFYKCKCFIINIIHVWFINASSRREHFKFEPFVYTILSIKYVQTKPYMYKKTSFTDLGCESLSYTWMILSFKCSVKKFKPTTAGSYNITQPSRGIMCFRIINIIHHHGGCVHRCCWSQHQYCLLQHILDRKVSSLWPAYCCTWIVPFLIC